MKKIKLFMHIYLISRWDMNSFWCSLSNEFVHQSDIGKCTTSHNRIVTTTWTIRIEFTRSQTEKKKTNSKQTRDITINKETFIQYFLETTMLLKKLKVSTNPLSARYLAAALFLAILPAGEIWSVVTESPKFNNA